MTGGPPAAPAVSTMGGGGPEAAHGVAVSPAPDLPEAFTDPGSVEARQELVNKIGNEPPDSALGILDQEHEATKPPAPEGVAPPTEQNAAAIEEAARTNQDQETIIQSLLQAQGLEDTPENRVLVQEQGASVSTEDGDKKQEREAQKAEIDKVFDDMSEIYKQKPDLVIEYCQEWVKRDPKAAKAFAEAGNEYMKILMQKKSFNKAIIVGGLLVALWLMFQTMTSDGQH